jgi:putative SOS response-associated peptidase YedK
VHTKGGHAKCGRFEVIDGKQVWVRSSFRRAQQDVLPNLDVRPTQPVPIVLADHTLELAQWGLLPSWAPDAKISYSTFNARAEGIETKPAFKRSLVAKRCIIPASAFFEWTGARGHTTKYRIARRDGDLLGFAGLYDTWRSRDGDELKTCTVIMTTPNAVMAPIHTRMPVILLPDQEEAWLDPGMTEPQEILSYLRPYPDELLEAAVAA